MSHDAVLLFLQSCCVWEQPLSLSKHKEWQRVVFRPAGHFCHISFAFSFFFLIIKKKKNHFISLELCTFISVRLCGVQSHVLRGPRHPGTPFWVVRRRGTRSRSRLPSWRRRNGWLGDRAPASRSSGLSTGTPQEPRFHRAERDSAQSAETQHNPLFMTSNYQRWVSPEIPLLLEDHIKYALRSNPPDFH